MVEEEEGQPSCRDGEGKYELSCPIVLEPSEPSFDIQSWREAPYQQKSIDTIQTEHDLMSSEAEMSA